MTGGDVIQFFTMADTDKDNYLTEPELKGVFAKLGINISDTEANALIKLFDKNMDGRASYNEICKYFSDVTSAKSIKDPAHWAYYIFEMLRRHCSSN